MVYVIVSPSSSEPSRVTSTSVSSLVDVEISSVIGALFEFETIEKSALLLA